MKKRLLLFTMLLMGLTVVSATNQHNHESDHHKKNKNFDRYAQPIIFMERGVEFLIFPDGSFDFNTNNYNSYYNDDAYYKSNRSKRSSVNVIYRGPNANMGFTNNRNNGVYISRDRSGQVRRIGNVFLNYDRLGKITRVGSVFIDYVRGRNGTLRQVGGLRVNYNHWGEIVNLRGQVKRYQDDFCNVCGVNSCNMTHDFGNHRDRHYDNDRYDNRRDDNFYYYKKNGKVKKHKKNKR
ncbi:hypothetical protein [uncultured Algibacter sp.]|uniref:hypothetical protein n=1 Tax=uncultured Algibacter sp. TaxID=298659 RepID=UPI0026313205|nr:hypothetical protein [uncultured Algibacter sp.]